MSHTGASCTAKASGPLSRRWRAARPSRAVSVVAMFALVALTAPAPAEAAKATQATFTISGVLRGTLQQSPAIACLEGLSAESAVFTIQGNLTGAPKATVYDLRIATPSMKGGTWTNFGPASRLQLTFIEQTAHELNWAPASGKLKTSPRAGSLAIKFAPEKGEFTPKGDIQIKGSWSC